MYNQAAYQQYQKVQVETATPGSLLIMLYHGCIRFLKLAEKNLDEQNYVEANNFLLKSQDIIYELMGTLDKVKGGEIAENLEQLYVFMIEQLVNANIKKDKKPVIVVRDLMTDLLETWKKII